jgi:1-phosphatidylinositol-3-phosphate 5-kinase
MYYATQFEALRKLVCDTYPGFVASLAESKNWEAKGGKSGSSFSKTMGNFLGKF